MTIQIAILVMLLYAVGVGFLNRILHKRLPPVSQQYIALWLRPWLAIFWMWGPTLWFVPGLVWLGVLNCPPEIRFAIIVLSVFLPLFIYVIFTSLLGLFPYRKGLPTDKVLTYFSAGAVGLVTIIYLGRLFMFPALTLWKALFFCVLVSLHPCIGVLALALTAPKVFPCPSSDPRLRLRNSLLLLTSFFTGYPEPVWVVHDGEVETRVQGDPIYGSGPGWLLTEPENVAILGNGSALTRIENPGVVIMNDSESPYRVVDLRNQKRSINTIAVTRDGIEVNVPLAFSFRIDSGPGRPILNNPWPVHKRDVFKAVLAEVVDPDGKTPLDNHLTHPWEDLPVKIAVYKLKQAVAYYSLFELYGDGSTPEMQAIHERAAEALDVHGSEWAGYPLTRTTIGNLVFQSVRNLLEPHGFAFLAGGIEDSIIPVSKELTRQRVEAWKTRWITKVMHWQAEMQTKSIAELPEVGDEAALKLMGVLIQELYDRAQRQAAGLTKQAVADGLISTLLDIAQNPDVAPVLSDAVLPTLMRLQQEIREP